MQKRMSHVTIFPSKYSNVYGEACCNLARICLRYLMHGVPFRVLPCPPLLTFPLSIPEQVHPTGDPTTNPRTNKARSAGLISWRTHNESVSLSRNSCISCIKSRGSRFDNSCAARLFSSYDTEAAGLPKFGAPPRQLPSEQKFEL